MHDFQKSANYEYDSNPVHISEDSYNHFLRETISACQEICLLPSQWNRRNTTLPPDASWSYQWNVALRNVLESKIWPCGDVDWKDESNFTQPPDNAGSWMLYHCLQLKDSIVRSHEMNSTWEFEYLHPNISYRNILREFIMMLQNVDEDISVNVDVLSQELSQWICSLYRETNGITESKMHDEYRVDVAQPVLPWNDLIGFEPLDQVCDANVFVNGGLTSKEITSRLVSWTYASTFPFDKCPREIAVMRKAIAFHRCISYRQYVLSIMRQQDKRMSIVERRTVMLSLVRKYLDPECLIKDIDTNDDNQDDADAHEHPVGGFVNSNNDFVSDESFIAFHESKRKRYKNIPRR